MKELTESRQDRREFLTKAAKVSGFALIGPLLSSACRMDNAMSVGGEGTPFDEALRMMAEIAPLSNHGPMAAEALVALGHEKKVIEFAKLYNRYYYSSYPKKSKPVTSENWKAAIASRDRLADWVEYLNSEIKNNTWKSVVAKWVPVFAPGLSAAAGHGVIRTGHAIRSLEKAETETRLDELAQALGYWAAYFQKLPENEKEIATQWSLEDAITHVPMIEPSKVNHTRSIMGKIEVIAEWDDFSGVIDELDVSGEPSEVITSLTETFAALYAKHANRDNHVSLIHTVTGTAMLRSILPHLNDGESRRIIRYAWQMAAAIYSASGNTSVNVIPEKTDLKPEDLVKRAVDSNEVHAIKFTEACLREYKINPKPIYLIAIDDALGRLGRLS